MSQAARSPSPRYIPLKITIVVAILALVLPLLILLSVTNYLSTRQSLLSSYDLLQAQTEDNIVNGLHFADNGYKMFERSLETSLERAFLPFNAAYESSGRDPSNMDFEEVRLLTESYLSMDVDVYLINAAGVVEYTTFETDLGLDLSQFDNFFANLTRIRESGEFAADRFTTETLTGRLRKYAYQATNDRQYLMEIGITTDQFQPFIAEFDERTIARDLVVANPALDQIRTLDSKAFVIGDPDAEVSDEVQAIVDDLWTQRGGRYEIEDPGRSQIRHYVFVDLRDPRYPSDASRVVELTYNTRLIDAALQRLLWRNILVGLIATLLAVMLAYVISRRLSNPILGLVNEVDHMVQGDLQRHVPVRSHSELQILERSINAMVDSINTYIRQLREAEQERVRLETIEQELARARQIQQGLLPQPSPRWPRLDVACFSTPAYEMGGDLYAYHAFSDDQVAVAVGDVSGKGMPAALLMSVSLASFQSMLYQRFTPAALLTSLDTALTTYTATTEQNCAFVYAEIMAPNGRHTGRLRAANAGCIFPLIRRANGTIEWVEVFGLPLGVDLSLQFDYPEAEVELDHDDMIIFTSDGVVEAMNHNGEIFGFDRLSAAVAAGPQHEAAAMLQHLRNAISNFVGAAEPNDDLTIVVVRV